MRRLATVLALSAMVLTAACTGGGGAKSSSASSSSQRGGTLRMGIEKPDTFDPAAASPASQSDLLVADLLFDGLTAVGPDNSVQPAIAQSWTHSDDLKVWTFALRSDATFANGRAVTAADVKYSLERVVKKGEASLSALRLDVITGWKDLVAGTATELTGVKAVSPSSVEIDLDAGMAAFPAVLSSPVYGIVPKEAVEATSPAFASAPVGSGPFAYGSATADVVTLQRAPRSTALLDAIELHLYASSDAAYTDFKADKLDWSPVPNAQAENASTTYGASTFAPFQAEIFYAFNLLDPTFQDGRFRKAIVKALDRPSIVKAVYPDVALPLDGTVPTGLPGSTPYSCADCAHDVDGAKALLAAAFPDGTIPTVHLDYATSPTADAIAGAMEAQLTAAGIPVEKRPKSADDYDAFVSSGQQQLFQFGWLGMYPDPDGYLVPLFTAGSRDNPTGYGNAETDAALAAARLVVDDKARATAFASAEALIMSDQPIVPLAQLRSKVVVSSRVKDVKLNVNGTFDAEHIRVNG